MQINNKPYTPSFSSKINFVYYDNFAELINPHNAKIIPYSKDIPCMEKSDEFYTLGLRSCSGGGLVSKGKSALGFHFFDSQKNLKDVAHNVKTMFTKNPENTNGLLIGSKDLPNAPFSIPQFKELKKEFSKRLKNISIFETHALPTAETNFHYSLKDDTWTICTQYFDPNKKGKEVDVVNLKTLKEAFKKIKIADGDELYLNDFKVKKQDAPDLFESAE
jgi:hypothetical protein